MEARLNFLYVISKKAFKTDEIYTILEVLTVLSSCLLHFFDKETKKYDMYLVLKRFCSQVQDEITFK